MIDRQTIDRIMDAANIVDVVSEFVTLRRRGVNYVGLCPFHTDKSPSFYVSPAKNICKCFACGEGGTVVHFIMKHEQLSYPEALRYLAKKYNIEIPERELSDQERLAQNARESLLVVNAWAQQYFASTLLEHEEGRTIGLAYFRERGFREDIIRKFGLGYCLDRRDAFHQAAVRQGFREEFLEKTGLVTVYDDGHAADRFRARVLFPIHTLSGKVVAFGGRTLQKGDKIAKYVNSPESELYHKSNELYGIFFARQAIVRADRCFLVEGYTDVISMHQAGIENVVASSGTALTAGQIRLIRRFTNNITVLYDGDAAGIKAAIRGIDMLLEEGMNVKVLLLPDGEDPDSFARQHNASALAEFIQRNETDFIRFKTRLLLDEAGNDPLKRTGLITDILRSIAVIPESIARSVYIRECSSSLEVDERTLLNEVNRIRLSNPVRAAASSPTLPGAVAASAPASAGGTQAASAGGTPSVSAATPSDKAATALSAPSLSLFEPFERSLIRYIIRYGHHEIGKYIPEGESEEVSLSVTGYIRNELEVDGFTFHTPLFQTVFDEAVSHDGEGAFDPQRHFFTHPDIAVSRLAADLIGDKYPLSRVHFRFREEETETDNLPLLVSKDLFALKNAHIEQRRKEVQTQLKAVQDTGDMSQIGELMSRIAELDRLKGRINKQLGERIILKM
ncbi:MAG: DNA primase [Tannerellaceae bacterium]|jgi:DNA primase|nr:DNA primase [Tannerellaceae bacterium]